MTIWDALVQKLGREPTHAELKAEVKRILSDGLVEMAEAGKLPHQRKRIGTWPGVDT